ncbi:MAG TPA: hypothetical protein VMF13_17590 [Luteitalea sp.]|nr:hypothetical protein [Luteitalea sp.]
MPQILLTLVLACSLAGQAQAPPVSADAFMRQTPEQLKAGIDTQHPAAYYVLAGKLLQAGQKDEAVFWFYAGQLRYRFHLGANPNLPRSGDPALFASLSEVVGRPVNEYAFGDLDALSVTIDKVLDWDAKTPNGFTSTTTHATTWKGVRDGLAGMRAQVLKSADQIRAQRTKNGLENRRP